MLRVSARRRLDPVDDPAIEMHEAGAQQRRVVDDAAEVLGVLDRARRIGGRRLGVGRRPDAEAVLRAGEVVDAHVRPVRDVVLPSGSVWIERRVAAMVLGRRVRVEDAEAAASRVEPSMERILHSGLRIDGGLVA